jgi:RNA recognition motif-containing protein
MALSFRHLLDALGTLADEYESLEAEVRALRSENASLRAASFTTLMFRNLPNSYTRNMLSELLDNEGFSGHYDLVYVPVDFIKLAGLGYAFVNFTSNEAAEKARQAFQGFAAWKNTSQKVCEVLWSGQLQGLSAHIEHYRNSPVMHESVPECYKPGLFQGGLLRPFPHPTKEIKTPRMKRRGFHHK